MFRMPRVYKKLKFEFALILKDRKRVWGDTAFKSIHFRPFDIYRLVRSLFGLLDVSVWLFSIVYV